MLRKRCHHKAEHSFKANVPKQKSYSETDSENLKAKIHEKFEKEFDLKTYYGHHCHQDPDEAEMINLR